INDDLQGTVLREATRHGAENIALTVVRNNDDRGDWFVFHQYCEIKRPTFFSCCASSKSLSTISSMSCLNSVFADHPSWRFAFDASPHRAGTSAARRNRLSVKTKSR